MGSGLKVERVPLARLKPAEWNPRILRDTRFRTLCKSLQADPDFMELRPILATADGTIYGGNMRWRAASHLGWETVPAIIADIPEQLAKERALKDNNQFGEWDEQALGEMLVELKLQDSDLALLGFDDLELNRLLDGVGALGESAEDPGADLDRAAELQQQWQTERGQLWEIGKHRLLCGDSTRAEDVARLMGGERADCVYTDPPYGVDYDGGAKKRESLAGDHVGTSIYADSLAHLREAAADHAALYLWYADAHAAAAAAAAAAAGYEITAQIIWAKNHAQFVSSAHYHGKHEPCYYAHRRGKSARWVGPNNEVTLWEYDRANVNDYHPTQKPVELAARAISNSSNVGDLVLDLFLGSAATMVAAEQTGRVCFGMEIEPKYVAVALQRLSDMGLTPRLVDAP